MIAPAATAPSGFERLRAIADAVLLEGYVLYPYRADAPKNRLRFSFGVVAPRAWVEASGSDRWWIEAQIPIEGEPAIAGALRFLRLRRRTVEARGADGWRPVERLAVGDALHLPWDEGVTCEIAFEGDRTIALPAEETIEEVRDAVGALVGRVRRRCDPLDLALRVRTIPLGPALHRLEVRIENACACPPGVQRAEALRRAALSTHVLLAAPAGAFVSLVDPPAHAAAAARGCRSAGCWPVLGGPPGDRSLALAAPFILYDHPQIAPESPGDLCDATEIDELLSLRTATLTPAEKRLVRATDPRGAAILDRVERLAPGDWERLHGTRRLPAAEIQPLRTGPALGPGSRVILRPGARRTDAQDLLFAGMRATVHRIERDVDGDGWAAVTLDDDPAAELHEWYGRFHYYRLDELEPLEEPAP